MDIALTVLSAALQGLLAYWGFKLSTGPLETPRQHQFYKWGFILVGVAGIGITALQGVSNNREKGQLNEAISKLTEGVGKVEEQTKQPPTITVNVPPAQVIASAQRMPLPEAKRLTPPQFPSWANNDPTWFDVAGYPVRLDWRELDGVDVYAEISVWAKECYGGRARIFDLTSETSAVEGPWISARNVAAIDFSSECKPVFQRLKLPRGEGARRYALQLRSGGNGPITAIGEVVFERKR